MLLTEDEMQMKMENIIISDTLYQLRVQMKNYLLKMESY